MFETIVCKLLLIHLAKRFFITFYVKKYVMLYYKWKKNENIKKKAFMKA